MTEAVKREKEVHLTVKRLRKSQTKIIEMYGRAREQYVHPVPAAMMNFSTKTVQYDYDSYSTDYLNL